MGDQLQQQLVHLLNLFQDEHAANIARQETINARLDAQTQDLAVKMGRDVRDHCNHSRGIEFHTQGVF